MVEAAAGLLPAISCSGEGTRISLQPCSCVCVQKARSHTKMMREVILAMPKARLISRNVPCVGPDQQLWLALQHKHNSSSNGASTAHTPHGLAVD